MGIELRGKTLGIVGFGNIGKIVAQGAVGLGMKVLAFDPFLSKEIAARAGVESTAIWASSSLPWWKVGSPSI